MITKFQRYFIVFIITLSLIFTAAIATAENNLSSVNNSPNYLQQGKQLYDRGQQTEAISLWQQAIETYAQQGDLPSQAVSYNYMAIAYQDLGEWLKAEKSLAIALQLINTIDDNFLYAQVLNTQGNLEARRGEPERAIATWQEAEAIYRQLNTVEPLLRTQINQAQALRSIGYGWRARKILEQANAELATLPDSALKAQALQSLGITLRTGGDLLQSQAVLNQSLRIAQKMGLNEQIMPIKLSLASIATTREDYQTARSIYQQILDTATNKTTQVKARINLIKVMLKTDDDYTAVKILPQAIAEVENLPVSIDKVYAQVNLASILIDRRSEGYSLSNEIPNILQSAIQETRKLFNPKLESYALGELGHYYEQDSQWQQAQAATKQAILLADNNRADDIAVRWYWQQGRIYQETGETEQAIASYQQAITTLQSLRQDIVAIDPEIQFSFRRSIEPLYRQYVQLLLEEVDTLPPSIQQEYLANSRDAIESLQLAELENFLREACIISKAKPIAEIDSQAAVIYPILLEDRLEVILSLPGKPLQHYGSDINVQDKEQVFTDIDRALAKSALATDILDPAQQLYDWLIRPAERALTSQKINTIVFVLDDWLRGLPMSVLHDGEDYLIKQYNIALSPGLQLLDDSHLKSDRLKTITGAITEARQDFPMLPNVAHEVKQIKSLLPTQVLINQTFTPPNLKTEIATSPASVVHLATYGQFSSKAEDTFLLTWKDRLNVRNIAQLLHNQDSNQHPLELLVLSASKTATEDKRAALGMTGMAVRSGAKTTVASLWNVRDRSTAKLMTEFYQLLSQKNVSKASALRQAQLALMEAPQYNHPYYWSPFVLIGNWQ